MKNIITHSLHNFFRAGVAGLLLFSASSQATVIDAYFGWNLCCDSSVPSPLEITSITYTGGTGLATTAVPAFPGPFGFGMPDSPLFVFAPTFTSSGDGETTRTIGATMPIDWDMTTFAYPSIAIHTITVHNGVGFSTASFPSSAYVVGLIPPGSDTELTSTLPAFQGDIYDSLAGAVGNPVAFAAMTSGPLSGIGINVSFAAAAVPIPAAAWLFGSALGLLGWMRRKAA